MLFYVNMRYIIIYNTDLVVYDLNLTYNINIGLMHRALYILIVADKSVSFEKSVSFSDEPPDMNSPKQHSPQSSGRLNIGLLLVFSIRYIRYT